MALRHNQQFSCSDNVDTFDYYCYGLVCNLRLFFLFDMKAGEESIVRFISIKRAVEKKKRFGFKTPQKKR